MKIMFKILILSLIALLIISCGKKTTSPDDEQVATPTFSSEGGSYDSAIEVLISCSTAGASIRYTTDGSEPTSSSQIYSAVVQISSNTTLKAKAYKSGWISSATSTAVYLFDTVAQPIFTPAGGTYSAQVTVSITCETADAQIRFTTDGSEPIESSGLYLNPITISTTTNLQARAFLLGKIPSPIMAATYNMQVISPVFSPEGGYYPIAQTVKITSETANAQIRYTLDGTDPTEESSVYHQPLNVSFNTIIKAKAFKIGCSPSEISSSIYIINVSDQMQLVAGGTFNNGTSNVTLSSFYIAKREVTRLEWVEVMNSIPPDTELIPELPIFMITWFDAINYCNSRSIIEGYVPCYSYNGYGSNPDNWPLGWDYDNSNQSNISCNWNATGYRLPTEMEWMFAARSGNQSLDYVYSGSNNIDDVAWYVDNSGDVNAVGTKQANDLGLFDMSGNLWEFCWDIYNYQYPAADVTNPVGASSGVARVMRGGSWNNDASSCTIARRFYSYPLGGSNITGFRVARKAP